MHAGKLASEALGTRGTAARPCVRDRGGTGKASSLVPTGPAPPGGCLAVLASAVRIKPIALFWQTADASWKRSTCLSLSHLSSSLNTVLSVSRGTRWKTRSLPLSGFTCSVCA